tara:strand:- start:90 stop:323 length:234 start_codon:yes stop_codon:yes gene_type:complete
MNTSLGVAPESIDCVRFIKEKKYIQSETAVVNKIIDQSTLIQIAKVTLNYVKNKVKAPSLVTLNEGGVKQPRDQVEK